MPKHTDESETLGGIRDGLSKRMRSVRKATSERTESARKVASDGVAAVGDSNPVVAIKTAGGSVVEGATEAASRGSDAARSAAIRSGALAREGLSSARERIPWDTVMPEVARSSVLSAVESSRALSKDAKRKLTTRAAPVLGELFDRGKDSQAQVLSILQGLLASSEGSAMVNS